jgi:hypothetical protein
VITYPDAQFSEATSHRGDDISRTAHDSAFIVADATLADEAWRTKVIKQTKIG